MIVQYAKRGGMTDHSRRQMGFQPLELLDERRPLQVEEPRRLPLVATACARATA